MKEIKTIQNEFKKKSRNMEWERGVRSWDWKVLLKSKPSETLKARDFATNIIWYDGKPGAVRIYDIQKTNSATQKRFVKLLQSQGKHTSKSVFTQQAHAKTHIVIDIKSNSKVRLDFTNQLFDYWGCVYLRIGKNAEVEIRDTHSIQDAPFGGASVFVDVGAGASVRYHIEAYAKYTYQSHYVFYLAKCSTLTALQQMSPQTTQLHTHHVVHSGVETKTSHTWMLDAHKQSHVYGNIVNYHKAKHTTADVVVKSVGRNRANVKIDGWIDIGKKALDTNSYLQQDVLLLSEKANVRAVPNLEILNNDVVASHGATLGMVDEQQLRYLQSRGLSKKLAEKVIIKGFLKSASERYNRK
ncbi:MAG: SufB/SufD family protein [Patescibacteria group bacterium]